MTSIDAVTFELITNTIATVLDEMSLTLLRTSHSNSVRDGMDFATALCDDKGRLVAQGISVPLLLGSVSPALAAVLARFGTEIKPGDVFAVNDPYSGGTHLPDIFLFTPVFWGECIIGYLGVVTDHVDIGGRSPGGRGIDSSEIYQEGLRIPPIRLVSGGRRVQEVWDLISINVRVPDKVIGDLDACLAAFRSAETLFFRAIRKFGDQVIRAYCRESLEYSRRMVRQVIASLPDGRYEFSDYVDDEVTSDRPVLIHVAVEVIGDRISFDYSKCANSVLASINCPLSSTKSTVYTAVRALMPRELLINEGFCESIEIVTKPGTIASPVSPAAVACRGASSFRILDATMGALAQLAPDKILAAGEGGSCTVRMSGVRDDGQTWILWDTITGTWGARPDRDGIDGCANFGGNPTNVPVEVQEAEYPIRITRYGLRSDSGGAGRFRGGLGLEREYEVLSAEALMVIRSDRSKFSPWGLCGGSAGERTRNVLIREGEPQQLASKFEKKLRRGERFLHLQASGGGHGNPRERDPNAVLADWRNEKVSIETARDVYGVAIEVKKASISWDETRRLRTEKRADERADGNK